MKQIKLIYFSIIILFSISLISAFSSSNLGFRQYNNSCTYYLGLSNESNSCDSNLSSFSRPSSDGDIIAIYPINLPPSYIINITLKVNSIPYGMDNYPQIYAWNEAGLTYEYLGSPSAIGLQNISFTLSSSQKVSSSGVQGAKIKIKMGNSAGQYSDFYEGWLDYIIDNNNNYIFNQIENISTIPSTYIGRFLQIPQNTILTNAYLNLSGYNKNSNFYIPLEYSCTNSFEPLRPCTYAFNGDLDSDNVSQIRATNKSGVIYLNYSGYANNINTNIYFEAYNLGATDGIHLECYNNTSWNEYAYYNTVGTHYLTYPMNDSCNNLSKIQVRLTINDSNNGGTGSILFNEINQTANYYPRNASFAIVNGMSYENVWTHLGTFDNSNNKTNNLANYFNNYLSTCSYTAGYCYIPVGFYSDNSGILMYSDLIFNNYGFIENSQNYTSNTYETTNEEFKINITYDSNYYQVSTANLIYNNSIYSSTKSTNGLNTIFTTNISIPLVNVDKINNSFYWSILLTNTTGTFSFNTSLENQTINQIFLGNCGGLNSSLALNITAYNEKTLDRINPFLIAGTLTYSIGNSLAVKSYSFGNISINEKNICININTTYTINGLIQYSNDSYQPSTFYFLNYEINNLTKDFALYLLPIASSTSFILQVQDQNILPLAGYSIKINRYYPAYDTYQTVQVVKTDENGQSIAFLETETVDYQFLIYDTNNNLIYTSDRRKIIPQSTPYTITFTVGPLLPSPLSYLENLTGLTYGLTYDKDTMKVTYTYADSNSSFTSSRLIVSALNLSGSNNILCNSTLSTPSGVIICDLTGNLSGTYSAIAYITRDNTNFIDNIVFQINTFADTAGLLGVMGGFFILLICAFLFPFSHTASIIVLNIGIIFLNIMSFVNFGPVAITAIISISILILIIFERD